MALPFEQHALAELAKAAPTDAPVDPREQWARLKGREHDQIQTLIERDEKSGTLNQVQANDYRTLNDRGRLLLYGVGGEFDDYLSRDELNANLTEKTRATTIMLFNPAWGDGKAEVTLGELSQAFDRKEAVALVDTLRTEQGLEIEALEWDPEHRKVFAAVKNEAGKFRIEMNLDDGTHGTPKYHVTDKNGNVADIEKNDLGHLGTLDYAAPQEGKDAQNSAEKASAAVPKNREGTLNRKFTTMAKFKKEFFREDGMPEHPYRQERQAQPAGRKMELPPKAETHKGRSVPSTPALPSKAPPQEPPVQPRTEPTPTPAPAPTPKQEPERGGRFTGDSTSTKGKSPSLLPALTAGGITGGTLISGASAAGLFTLLSGRNEEATAFVDTLLSLFA